MSTQFGMPASDPASTRGLAQLRACLATVTDPRRRQGRRHELATVVGIAVAAVMAGSCSYVAIGAWAANAPRSVLAALGVRARRRDRVLAAPEESTIRGLLGRVDDGEVAAALGAWLIENTEEADLDALIALALDGKSVRGARTGQDRCVHLLSVLRHGLRTTLAAVTVDAKTNEIPAAIPLLSGLGLAGTVVVTADALHTQRETIRFLREDKDWHFVLPVAENQPTLFAALDAIDWTAVEIGHTATARGHGRVETRTIQVGPVPTGLAFEQADKISQVFLIERQVTDLTGKMTSAAACLGITSLTADRAGPAQLAALVRGQWEIENGSHYVRDVTYREDASRVRTGNGPAVMAALRGFAIGALRSIGAFANIAEAHRWAQRDYRNPLSILGIRLEM